MKRYRIGNIIFTVNEEAEQFLSKLQSVLTAETSSKMLGQTVELYYNCLLKKGFAVSFKAFLDSASWSCYYTPYTDNPRHLNNWSNQDGHSAEKSLKWVELLGQFDQLDRKVCFSALILAKTADVVDNILKNDPNIDFKNLHTRIKEDMEDHNFLSSREFRPPQLWANLDKELVEINHVSHSQEMWEAEDFSYSSFNYVFFKASEAQ